MSLSTDVGPQWTGEVRALLDAAIRRHGGWDAWRSLGSLIVRPQALSGLVPWLKGFGRTFRLPSRAQIWPHDGTAIFFDYPTAGASGTFSRGSLTIADGGATVAAIPDARPSFRGLRKLRRWSPAHALYFFGYALTHYHGLPFTLGLGQPLGIHRVRYQGRRLTGIEVRLPLDLHTHSRRQTFYFEEDGLLRRHDYVADIVGGWARGAHFWRDFVTVSALQMASVRHVVARLGQRTTPFVALHAELAMQEGASDPPPQIIRES
jgi:hypothetical protein